jgi:ribose transport system substrate-binding protein
VNARRSLGFMIAVLAILTVFNVALVVRSGGWPPWSDGEDAAVEASDPRGGLAPLESIVMGLGPHDEAPTAASEISLTASEVQRVGTLQATVAIVVSDIRDPAARAKAAALRAELVNLGIQVRPLLDARSNSERQNAFLRALIQERPSAIVVIPVDAGAALDALREIGAAGIKLVLLDAAPRELEAGTEYVSVVSSDNFGNGIASAHLLALAVASRGKVGALYFEGEPSFATAAQSLSYHPPAPAANQRLDAFRLALQQRYPGITLVDEIGLSGPDFVAEARNETQEMLRRHPDLDAIWTAWSVPAQGVLAAARTAGRDDLDIVTLDLDEQVALELARGGLVKGVAAQRAHDVGVVAARLVAYGLLDKEAPPYIALSALPVERANTITRWRLSLRVSPSAALLRAGGRR